MAIAKIWRNRIEAGTKLFENCPLKYKADVEKLMREDVVNEIITADQFTELTGIPYEEVTK